jgi:Cytochrome P460
VKALGRGISVELYMSPTSIVPAFVYKHVAAIAYAAVLLALFGAVAIAAQDKYTLQVPNGLAFADFRGYEDWQDVAVSQTETGMKVIVANPVMIEAFKSGLPSAGKLFPDGSKIAKIEWTFKKNEVSPYFVNVPNTLKSVSFIEKDLKRFPNTHGWAYAQFTYDPAADTFKPNGEGAACGFACHAKVAAQDYTFTAYPKR